MACSKMANGVDRGIYEHQTYVRNEGQAILRKLPSSARNTLRYYEMAATVKAFQPLAPLRGQALGAKNYLYFAVTDWSLYVLSRSGGSDPDGVLLEVPWLDIKDLDITTVDNGEVLEPVNGKSLKANIISLFPKVDIDRLPKALADRISEARKAEHAPSEGAQPSTAAAGSSAQHSQPPSTPWYKKLFGGDSKQGSTPAPGQPMPQLHTPGPHTPGQVDPVRVISPDQPRIAGHDMYSNGAVPQPLHGQQGPVVSHPGPVQSLGQRPLGPYQGPVQPQCAPPPPIQVSPARHIHSAAVPQPQPQQSYQHMTHGVHGGIAWQGQDAQHMRRGQPLGEGVEGPTHYREYTAAGVLVSGPSAGNDYYHPMPHGQQYQPFGGRAGQAWNTPALQQYHPGAPGQAWRPPAALRVNVPSGAGGMADQYGDVRTPTSAWVGGKDGVRGERHAHWGPVVTHIPPPLPVHLKAPVLPPVDQPAVGDEWPHHQPHTQTPAEDIVLHDYALVLITLERHTKLAYHIRMAWLNAHMRAAVARAAVPGTPLWFTPPVTIPGAALTAQQLVLQYLTGRTQQSPGLPVALPPPSQLVSHLFPGTPAASTHITHHTPQSAMANDTHVSQLVDQLSVHVTQPVTNQQVEELWRHAEALLMQGCSLWDEHDETVMQDLLLHASLCTGPTAHAHSAAFFKRPFIMTYVLSRLYAWGAVCALWGPKATRKDTSRAVTPYVQWVLSRNDHVKDAQGRGVEEILAPPATPWQKSHTASTTPTAPWRSPTYDHSATPRAALQAPATPTHSHAHTQGLGAPGHRGAQEQYNAQRALWREGGVGQGPVHTPQAGQAHGMQVQAHGGVSKPYRRPDQDPDRLSGKRATPDEEAYKYFLHLYRSHTWQGVDGAGQGGTEVLRRVLPALGLCSGARPSVCDTLQAVKGIITQQSRRIGKGQRSRPPDVQAPPTLAPYDPLSLSPLSELPYLFVLEVPEMAVSAQQALCGGGGGGSEIRVGIGAEGVRVVEAAAHRAQAQLQTRAAGKALQSQYMDRAMGGGDALQHNTHVGAVQARWERLVGRLAALRAWQKLQLLLCFMDRLMCDSEGCGERLAWCSDEVVEVDSNDSCEDSPHSSSSVSVWTRRRCARHIANLIPQLRDPLGPATLHTVLPQSPTDITWWCAAERHSTHLDVCASVLGHLSDISVQAAGDPDLQREGRGAVFAETEPRDVVVAAVRQLPVPLAHAFCRRLMGRLCALMVGSATLNNTHTRQQACEHKDLTDTKAIRVAEVLLLLLNRIAGASAAIHDSLDCRLFHTLRTPQVTSSLSQRGSDPVLGQLCGALLEEVLCEIQGGAPDRRPATWAHTHLSQLQVTNLASLVGRHRMPGVLI